MHSVAVQVPDLAATLARLEPLGVEVAVAHRSRDRVHALGRRPRGSCSSGRVTCRTTTRAGARRCRRSSRSRWSTSSAWRSSPRSCAIPRATASGWPRCSTPSSSRTTHRRRRRRAARARSTSATACSRCTRSRPTQATSRAVWGGAYERPRCLALGLSVADQDVGRTRARGRRRRRAPPRLGAPPRRARRRVCPSRSCSPTGCWRGDPPQYRLDPGGTMTSRDERLRAILEPSTTAVLTMELQNGVVGEGAMMGALVDELAARRARSTPCVGCATAPATPARASCTARSSHAPDGAGSTENCKIFAMSAKQRREHGSTATDLGSPGCRTDRRARRTRATSWCRACTA